MEAKRSFELTSEDLGGFTIEDLKCRACSGYGNCGYRKYLLSNGKPVLICQLRKSKLEEEALEEGGTQEQGQ